ncbi:MAG: PAS domain S-box protein [Archaeoglobaceae archaeon]
MQIDYKEIVERVLDALIVVDREARIVYANPSVGFFGYSPEELIGKSIFDFIPDEYRDNAKRIYHRYLESKERYSRLEIPLPDKSGKLRWVDVVISTIEENAEPTLAIMEIREITEVKKILKELEESREMYKTIFEAFPDFIGIIDREGRIISANKNFLMISNLSEEDVIGKSVFSFVHPDDAEKALRLFKSALETGSIVRDRIRAIIGGKEFVLDVSGRFIANKNFGIIVSKDVTESVRLEREICEREEFFEKILDSSVSGYLILEDGKIIYANRTAEKITGYSKEELMNKNATILFEEKLHKKAKEVELRILNGETFTGVTRTLRKDGKIRYAEVFGVPLDYKGKRFVLLSFEDVTEKRIMEKKLEEREELYRNLIESSHTGIFIIQKDRVVYANQKTAEILGYTLEEVNALEHPYDIVAPEFRELTKQRYMARERGEDVPEGYEVKVITKDGKEKWMKVLARRIKYKNEPAVLVNIADITKLKEDEEMLRRMNKLLRVSGEVKDMLLKEKSEYLIFLRVKDLLEKLDAECGIYVGKNSVPLYVPPSMKDLDVKSPSAYSSVFQRKGEDCYLTFLPVHDKDFSGIIVLRRRAPFTEEELKVIESIAKDISMRFKALKIEREREIAYRTIIENLKQFEELADRLRNPLAIMKGYIEIRKEVGDAEALNKVQTQIDRIERILDELRFREIATFELKKVLENKNYKNNDSSDSAT